MKTKNLTQLINESAQASELSVKFNTSYEMYYKLKSTGLVKAGGHLYVASKIFERIATLVGWIHNKPLVGTGDFPMNENKSVMSMAERASYLLRSSLDLRASLVEIMKSPLVKDLKDPKKLEEVYNLLVEALNNLMRASFFLDEALYFIETSTIKISAMAAGGIQNTKELVTKSDINQVTDRMKIAANRTKHIK
jgi:hypothetical protein